MADLVHDLENKSGVRAPRALFAGDRYTGQPTVVVSENDIALAASDNNAIHVTPDFGVTMSEKISFSGMPDQMSFGGGYWRLNPLLLTCIPSTTPTPIPVLVKADPELLRAKDHVSNVTDWINQFTDFPI